MFVKDELSLCQISVSIVIFHVWLILVLLEVFISTVEFQLAILEWRFNKMLCHMTTVTVIATMQHLHVEQ